MNIVFAGPSLHGVDRSAFAAITFRPPARRGDVIQAVADGARVIGLIDGVFENMPSIWHKEILHALSQGIAVAGAASMGALRAAECHAFGMIGIGSVFDAYRSGTLEDDEDVAQLHGPAELGYVPLSEPRVNIRATLAHLRDKGRLRADEHARLLDAAGSIFFKDRSYRRIVERAGFDIARQQELTRLLKTENINLKRQDALLLLGLINTRTLPNPSPPGTHHWQLADTRSLRSLLQDATLD
jgi:hypothetical protein